MRTFLVAIASVLFVASCGGPGGKGDMVYHKPYVVHHTPDGVVYFQGMEEGDADFNVPGWCKVDASVMTAAKYVILNEYDDTCEWLGAVRDCPTPPPPTVQEPMCCPCRDGLPTHWELGC